MMNQYDVRTGQTSFASQEKSKSQKKRKSTMPQSAKRQKNNKKTDQTYQKVALLMTVRLASASRVLLCRFEGKAAMPDRLQLKGHFKTQMNMIASRA